MLVTKHLVTEGYEYFSFEIAAVVAAVAVAATVDFDAAKLKKTIIKFSDSRRHIFCADDILI